VTSGRDPRDKENVEMNADQRGCCCALYHQKVRVVGEGFIDLIDRAAPLTLFN